MFSRRYSQMPMIFHAIGSAQNERVITPSTTSASIPSYSSSNINRFSMFQNLQNTKPCGSCGKR